MIYLELFWGFLKVGMFAFGGAYAAIPLIRDIVLSYGWLNDDKLSYMIAVSESTPGPIMVNLATYVGSSQAGLPGAVLATIAVIVILLVTAVMKNAIKNKYVRAALSGMKPCIIGIIMATGVYMILQNCARGSGESIINLKNCLVTLLLSLALPIGRRLLKNKFSPIMLIVLSACIGVMAF